MNKQVQAFLEEKRKEQEQKAIKEKNGIKYLPTFHPAALLRDESKKIDFWNDLKKLEYELIKISFIIFSIS